jgi:hypothetical protein
MFLLTKIESVGKQPSRRFLCFVLFLVSKNSSWCRLGTKYLRSEVIFKDILVLRNYCE